MTTKDRRLRQWAAKIVSDLPSEPEEAKQVLALAGHLCADWLGPVSAVDRAAEIVRESTDILSKATAEKLASRIVAAKGGAA
jgi:hypothetical protein